MDPGIFLCRIHYLRTYTSGYTDTQCLHHFRTRFHLIPYDSLLTGNTGLSQAYKDNGGAGDCPKGC